MAEEKKSTLLLSRLPATVDPAAVGTALHVPPPPPPGVLVPLAPIMPAEYIVVVGVVAVTPPLLVDGIAPVVVIAPGRSVVETIESVIRDVEPPPPPPPPPLGTPVAIISLISSSSPCTESSSPARFLLYPALFTVSCSVEGSGQEEEGDGCGTCNAPGGGGGGGCGGCE